jgi:hypothetical protein
MQKYLPRVKWFWKCVLEPKWYIVMAVISTVLSLILIWSEVTFSFEHPTLSLYAIGLTWQGSESSAFLIELITFCTLCYICVCTYRVIFILRVLDFYFIVPKQQTDSSSLLYAAMFLSRLTVPLCLNFISMAHLDSRVTTNNAVGIDTAFTRVRDVACGMCAVVICSFGGVFFFG